MRKLVFVPIVVAVPLTLVLAACGSASLEGTTWKGAVALTEVTVSFEGGKQYTSAQFGDGAYSINGDQVSLAPSGKGQTRVFVLNGSLLQGTVDGWPTTLTKQ